LNSAIHNKRCATEINGDILFILDKCKDIPGVLNPTLWWQGIWKTDCAIDKSGKLSEEFFEDADLENLELAVAEDKSAATAALKLCLKLKGIEYGK
jgi:hypothetical protein